MINYSHFLDGKLVLFLFYLYPFLFCRERSVWRLLEQREVGESRTAESAVQPLGRGAAGDGSAIVNDAGDLLNL